MDYSRVRIVSIAQKVEDLPGLLADLKNAFFGVINVGSDDKGTYLYMDVSEKKDPRPIVQAWISRKPVIHKPTTSILGRLFRKIW